jgi:hypothetical protein
MTKEDSVITIEREGPLRTQYVKDFKVDPNNPDILYIAGYSSNKIGGTYTLDVKTGKFSTVASYKIECTYVKMKLDHSCSNISII